MPATRFELVTHWTLDAPLKAVWDILIAPEGWPVAEEKRYDAATPLRRVGTPEDVARAVLYLVGADYVTGEILFVDGGRHGAR